MQSQGSYLIIFIWSEVFVSMHYWCLQENKMNQGVIIPICNYVDSGKVSVCTSEGIVNGE